MYIIEIKNPLHNNETEYGLITLHKTVMAFYEFVFNICIDIWTKEV